MNNEYTDLNNQLTTTNIENIQTYINNLIDNTYPSLTTIIDIYENILFVLLQSITQKNSLDYTNTLLAQYKEKDAILNNIDLLIEYIKTNFIGSNQKNTFSTSVEAGLLTVDPLFIKYISIYGFPENGEFNTLLLDHLKNE